MREIRFRFWNEQAHKYHYRANQVMPCLENQLCLGYDYTKEGCAFEQFTGLHDCTKWQDLTEAERAEWTRNGNMPSEWKGREIYEGDIVHVFDGDFKEDICGTGIGDVVFLEEWGMWYIGRRINNGLYDTNQEFYIEVIGNIHENPEFIEASHV